MMQTFSLCKPVLKAFCKLCCTSCARLCTLQQHRLAEGHTCTHTHTPTHLPRHTKITADCPHTNITADCLEKKTMTREREEIRPHDAMERKEMRPHRLRTRCTCSLSLSS